MRNTYKFHFSSSTGWLTIEQRWVEMNDRWEFCIWERHICYGENTRLTYEESLERLKELVLERSKFSRPFLQYTGCSIHRPLPEPLNIDLT